MKPTCRMRGWSGTVDHRLPRQHEVHVGPALLEELPEVREERDRALVSVDSSDVQHERPLEPVLRPEVQGGVRLGQVEAAADDDARHLPVAARVLDEHLLLRGQVDDPARGTEEGLEDAEVDRGILLGRGHEDRLVPDGGQAVIAVVVAVAVEEEPVEAAARGGHRTNELGRKGPVLAHPGLLLLPRVPLVEAQVRQRSEDARVARPAHGRAVDGNAVHHLGAPRVVVLPLEVIEGARGEYLDLVALGQPLGQPPAVQFRPAVHLKPVTLDDEGEPHGRAAEAARASSRSYFSMIRSQA